MNISRTGASAPAPQRAVSSSAPQQSGYGRDLQFLKNSMSSGSGKT